METPQRLSVCSRLHSLPIPLAFNGGSFWFPFQCCCDALCCRDKAVKHFVELMFPCIAIICPITGLFAPQFSFCLPGLVLFLRGHSGFLSSAALGGSGRGIQWRGGLQGKPSSVTHVSYLPPQSCLLKIAMPDGQKQPSIRVPSFGAVSISCQSLILVSFPVLQATNLHGALLYLLCRHYSKLPPKSLGAPSPRSTRAW